ncbi:hypothetical protein Pcinc_007368 [Petrolisthes cinctipes]|uniref:Uncharacterized protein n=1 Tax=Petrolisthes cinctipes TaxID=88211 RepID=A0AAE1G8R2_PETCI|nr:hypothetical protein Pcinc_007368 [Petrolisthes cinctipes]
MGKKRKLSQYRHLRNLQMKKLGRKRKKIDSAGGESSTASSDELYDHLIATATPSTATLTTSSTSLAIRAVANDEVPGPHKENVKTFLREDILAHVLPLYQRIASTELLQKCKGTTQNANESLHSVLWNLMPKTKFFQIKRVQYCAALGVTRFNLGAVVSRVEGLGSIGQAIAERKNVKKVNALTAIENKKRERRMKVQRKHQEEEKKSGGL